VQPVRLGLFTQKQWRIVCAVSLAGAAMMAWYAIDAFLAMHSIWEFIAYWGIFLALIAVALFIVVLDLRYIYMQYAVSEREIFRETLGDEAFRKALIAAQQKNGESQVSGD
jgi:hypothetical protein